MVALKGSRTETNLLTAFAGESQARNRYTMGAKTARKAGCEQIASIFMETADNEKQHAKQYFRHLEGGEVEITASYPAGVEEDMLAHLESAAAGEKEEWTSIYPGMAAIAEQEGFPKVATTYRTIAEAEEWHEKRFNKLIERVKQETVFKREQPILWKCRECGRVVEGVEPPELCPTCAHPRAFYEPYCECY